MKSSHGLSAQSRQSSLCRICKAVHEPLARLGRAVPLLANTLFLVCLGSLGVGCDKADDPVDEVQDDVSLEPKDGTCLLDSDTDESTLIQYLPKLGCRADYEYLASAPMVEGIPGARSGKVVLDTLDNDKLYFQNSKKYMMHHDFASVCEEILEHGPVGDLELFNGTQYSAPDRRFILGTITHYEPQQLWALEFAGTDTADAKMIEKLYEAVSEQTYFGTVLYFHPMSDALALQAESLPPSIPVITTDELYAKTDYQPLNTGTTVGQLRFMRAKELDTQYVSPKEVVVLDSVPNDIAVVAGLITEQFQTPLSHVNVLARNRGTPNMGLRNAFGDPDLLALKGEWVTLTVTDQKFTVEKITKAEADEWWKENGPERVFLPPVNEEQRELLDTDQIIPADAATVTKEDIRAATLAFGAKVANYAVLSAYKRLSTFAELSPIDKDRDMIPVRRAFGIPVVYYKEFMEQNGLFDLFDEMRADPLFDIDPFVRDKLLTKLRDAILEAPICEELQNRLRGKVEDYPGKTMRFRSSTNAEDLDGFPCAGCYDSHSGNPSNWEGDLLRAVKQSWSTVWKFRTYEEREFHQIDHKTVAMGLLVHENFPNEYANGVAITGNPFDKNGLVPAYYINVQRGGAAEVVAPPVGVTIDSFLYYVDSGSTSFMSHSNLVPEGDNVLDRNQTRLLADALGWIHVLFGSAYATGSSWAMDVEFKFNDEATVNELGIPEGPLLWIKQARPYHMDGQ